MLATYKDLSLIQDKYTSEYLLNPSTRAKAEQILQDYYSANPEELKVSFFIFIVG